jgi:hypothetical protein
LLKNSVFNTQAVDLTAGPLHSLPEPIYQSKINGSAALTPPDSIYQQQGKVYVR